LKWIKGLVIFLIAIGICVPSYCGGVIAYVPSAITADTAVLTPTSHAIAKDCAITRVWIMTRTGNKGVAYIGPGCLTSTTNGYPLVTNVSVTLEIDNLSKVFVSGDYEGSGDKVDFIAERQ